MGENEFSNKILESCRSVRVTALALGKNPRAWQRSSRPFAEDESEGVETGLLPASRESWGCFGSDPQSRIGGLKRSSESCSSPGCHKGGPRCRGDKDSGILSHIEVRFSEIKTKIGRSTYFLNRVRTDRRS